MKLLPFTKREPVPPREEGSVKFGLYPLGPEDLLLSVSTFEVVLYALRQGTEAERAEIADTLRLMYVASITEKKV